MNVNPDKKDCVLKIMDKLFKLDSPKMGDQNKENLSDFIATTINGDTPDAYLVVNAYVRKEVPGALIYILTNKRLIKIDIDQNLNDIKSSSFFLSAIIGIERKLMDGGNTAAVEVAFQNDSFGLKFSPKDKSVIDFFQQVDQARAPAKNG